MTSKWRIDAESVMEVVIDSVLIWVVTLAVVAVLLLLIGWPMTTLREGAFVTLGCAIGCAIGRRLRHE